MGDRFVDVSYRGLEVGRQLKLRDVTTDGGYLESTTPMPVGTPLEVVLDDGTRLPAVVAHIHEQVAGGTDAAGMRIRPVLAGATARRWWESQPAAPTRATPAPPEPVTAPAIIDVQPVTAPEPAIEPAEPPPNGTTIEMPSSAVEASSEAESSPDSPPDVSASGELAAVDDEDVSDSSGSIPAVNGSNGHGDKSGRTKRKGGKRRKRNTR